MTYEARKEIDRDFARGLLIINGGGAVSLLTIISEITKEKEPSALLDYTLVGLGIFCFGLTLAVGKNWLRRICDLNHEKTSRNFAGSRPDKTISCRCSKMCSLFPLLSFVTGASVTIYGGFQI